MNINCVAHTAALVGEPARAAMLLELMDGRALTATELARVAGITAATGSRHLAQLVQAGLLCVTAQGRHRYHRLATPQVARLLESIMQVATLRPDSPRPAVAVGPREGALRTARTCYDHLAGRLGVAIAGHLQAIGGVVFDGYAGHLTDAGVHALTELGVARAALSPAPQPSARAHCKPCLDWSERRFHVGGRVGTLLCANSLERQWLRPGPLRRALQITPAGQVAFRHWMGLARWAGVTD